MIEEIELHVLARERLCVITFNGKGFPTKVTDATMGEVSRKIRKARKQK